MIGHDAALPDGLTLPCLAQEVVTAYLCLVDAEAPGLVEAFYLVGSVALAAFHPQASDIDFVAVTATPCDGEAVATLQRVHARLAAQYRRPFFDGVYVTWDQLADNPLHTAPGPCAHEGQVQPWVPHDPVTWHTLAHHGVRVRGPQRQDRPIWTNRDVLASWTRDTLASYWRSWHRRRSYLLSKPGLVCLGSWGPTWGVLGVSRLHYTLATGAITSKEGAGLDALTVFPPRWRRIITECLRIRRGASGHSLYRTPLRRRQDALDFVALAIDNALSNT